MKYEALTEEGHGITTDAVACMRGEAPGDVDQTPNMETETCCDCGEDFNSAGKFRCACGRNKRGCA